jgi:hypothetical protein
MLSKGEAIFLPLEVQYFSNILPKNNQFQTPYFHLRPENRGVRPEIWGGHTISIILLDF